MRIGGTRRLRSCVAGLACCLAAGLASPAAAAVDVQVVRDGAGWTADYLFDRHVRSWAFSRSAVTEHGKKPWRSQSWTVATPGVRLERYGRFDVLVSDGGKVPRKVSIRFRPFGDRLLADYDAAMLFSDGAVALFSDHFNVFPLAAAAAAERLPIDHDPEAGGAQKTRVTFRDRGGRVLHGGRRLERLSLVSAQNYVLFGDPAIVENEHIASIIDPNLPEWLRGPLARSTLANLSFYAERLGPRGGTKPMLLASWGGPTRGLRSIGGGVLPGQVVLRFEGDALLREDAAARDSARRVVAHEGAHFWLGNIVNYASPDQAWITEGGADLLALRALASLQEDFKVDAALQELADECVRLGAGKPIRDAALRHEQRAYYACGAMFGLAAEAAARRSGGDFFSFWRRLIDRNRADGVVSQQDWLGELSRVSGDPRLAAMIRQMVEQGEPDPARSLAALFSRAGVRHSIKADGRLLLS